jgi:hypothetical protein
MKLHVLVIQFGETVFSVGRFGFQRAGCDPRELFAFSLSNSLIRMARSSCRPPYSFRQREQI